MLKDGATFVVTKPKSFLHKDLSADWNALFKSSGKMAAHALTKREDMLSDGAEFLTAVGLETTVEERLWVLIQRSLTMALGELLEPELTQRDAPYDGLIASLLSVESFRVEYDFLQSPEKLALLDEVIKPLRTWMAETESTPQLIENVVERLPRYFVYALQHEWRRNETYYAQIEKATDTPLSDAVKRQIEREKSERNWDEYRAFLRKQVDNKLFDESFGLRQIFVPLRAYYEHKPKTSRETRHNEERPERHVFELEDYLDNFLNAPASDGRLRLISGGPGSGKSSFSKMWAAKLAERDDLQVLFIPLDYLDVERELPDAVDEFLQDDLKRELGMVLDNPLKQRHPSKRLVLILDGLDELALQGKAAQDTARRWFNNMRDFVRLENQRQNSAPVLALVSGRDIAVQGVEMPKRECILHVLPYKISFFDAIKYYKGVEELIHEDRRLLWWQKYSERSAQFDGELPEEISSQDFDEITSWPLLNYLLAQTLLAARATGQKIEPNINEVYGHLLTKVYNRVWADEGNLHLRDSGFDESTFREVLQEVALAIWQSDSSAASESIIEERCKRVGLVESLNEFRRGVESGFARLLTAFYFRQKDQRAGERSFEFTHKSFGEYLTACRIVTSLDSLCQEWMTSKNKRQGRLDEEGALREWLEITGPQEADYYLGNFIEREIRQADLEVVSDWQVFLARLINHCVNFGVPTHLMNPRPMLIEEIRQASNAQLTLLMCHSYCGVITKAVSTIDWPDETSAGTWIMRMCGQRDNAYIGVPELSFLNFDGCCFMGQFWDGANLTASSFRKANLYGASLEYAFMQGCDFSDTFINVVNFDGTNLLGARLDRNTWQYAKNQGAHVDDEPPRE